MLVQCKVWPHPNIKRWKPGMTGNYSIGVRLGFSVTLSFSPKRSSDRSLYIYIHMEVRSTLA